ncbi:6-phosphogluconate dehydrogenase [Flavobacterium sp. GT3R68]|uniref:6-phosphogluconate dehydrogenase n=1 Tax=Flavobacterium sp. GT3R68 TaxID=2594437 RepID=UPI000F8940BD|nr:6-phosphogluconate dehydrogenase [Flavobacterium sp. GT3R68]RTY87263.1 6-phosphogluconate dehydrogenase [Flavobacterium sp. GSN2]TRW89413.1 6-phosphogluconate dehydrogenase [Flavobacterium sp. GT3R68]
MRKLLIIIPVALLLLLLCYYAFLYYVPYSEGVRSGELIKISNKGMVYKTWEGEVSQGISGAQIFAFSVLDKDKKVIEDLKNFQGQYVKVTYIERYRTFSWWGDTKYFVTNVEKEQSPHFNNR